MGAQDDTWTIRAILTSVMLAVTVLGVAEEMMACVTCEDSGSCVCQLRCVMLFAEQPPKGMSVGGDDSYQFDEQPIEWEGPQRDVGMTRSWVKFTWGKVDQRDKTEPEPLSVCFYKDGAPGNGDYYADDPYVKRRAYVNVINYVDVDNRDCRLMSKKGWAKPNNSIVVTSAESIELETQTFSGGIWGELVRGKDFYSWGDYDADNRPTLIEQKRSATTIRKTYFKYVEASEVLVRKRVTVEEYNSDGTKRFLTTIYAYYSSGDDIGRLKFVVRPEGVKRYLTSNGATTLAHGIDPDHPEYECDLDRVSGENSVSDESLDDYAEAVYTAYDGQDRVTEMTSYGAGCCVSSETGTYTFAYGENGSYPEEPNPDEEWNLWKTYRRITHPSGLRTVEFYNAHDGIIFKVVQETIQKRWVDHYKYYISTDGACREGSVKEHRYPSACAGADYEFPDGDDADEVANTDGWAETVSAKDTGTTGLVRLYDYHDPSGKIMEEKALNGPSGTVRILRRLQYDDTFLNDSDDYTTCDGTYNNVTDYDSVIVYRPWKETVYPSEWNGSGGEPSDKQETTYTHSYHQDSGDTHAVAFKTVKHPAVSTANNGSNSQTQVEYHYERDTDNDLYYNDWTWHEDGAYSYTELGTGTWTHGQVVQTVEDVDDDAGLTPPGDWDPPTSGHLNLTTTYTYWDATGSYTRLKSVTAPGDRKTVYAYMYQKQTDSGKETTTTLVTLIAPHMDGDDDYDYAPVSIAVADLAGRTVISAAGEATTDEGSGSVNKKIGRSVADAGDSDATVRVRMSQ